MKKFITIGTFDGVHRGHIKLFDALKKEARASGLRPLILYFPLPPKTLLSACPDMSVLTLPGEKAALLERARVDFAALDFEKVRALSAEQFLDLLVSKYKMAGLLAGKDFALGRGRAGHIEELRRLCAEREIKFVVEDFFNEGGHKISSSVVRAALAHGHMEDAAKLLGYKYFVQGKVVRGRQLGRELGFPTANLDVGRYKILPHGVFAATAEYEGKTYKAVVNIGFNPTVTPVHADIPLVEAHLLNFNENIYGKNLKLSFAAKLRSEKKFDSLSALSAQITADISATEKLIF